MRHLLVALILLVTGSSARGASNVMVLLESAVGPALDPAAVAQAVTIYTRDLGLALERRAGAPADITAENLGAVVELVRSSGIRLAFWVRVRADRAGVVLYAVANHDGAPTVHALRVDGVDPPEVYRVLALKVRAVLTGTAALEPEEPTPSPAPPQPPAPPVEPARPPPAALPVPRDESSARPAPAAAPRDPRARFAVGYVLTLPLDPTLLRHGVSIEGALVLRRRWELYLGVELASQPGAANVEGQASLFDLPIRLGVRVFARFRRVAIGAGAALSLHALSASGSGTDGSHRSLLTAAAGLGGDLLGRFRFTDRFGAELRVRVEELLPDNRFVLHGQSAFDAGGVVFSFGAGLTFALP